MAEIDSEAAAAKQGDLRGVLPAGSRLRSYELISVLGRGAFGITYRALDTTLHRDVAIKEYLPTSLALRDGGTMVMPLSTELAEAFVWGRDRFLDEARTLVKLDDVPAVVRVIDFLEDNGTAYMVMALARGETLAQRLRRDGPLPPSAIERILYPLLDGLEQVHAVGFLHRDIKPANIILDARDNPTLIDFGAARAAMAGRSTAMTAIFTPGYAAVEQFTSANQGPWTDIYGLSATLYHAMTGTVPPSAFDRMLDDTYAPLGRLLPAGFAPGLLAGIDAGLAVRGGERPDTIEAWRRVFVHGAPATKDDAATEVLPKPTRASAVAANRTPVADAVAAGRRRRVLWSAMAAAVIVVLAAGYMMFGSDRPPFGGQAVQNLTADQLEQALAERRKADAAAVEKKRLEEEAQRQADLDAQAKEAADTELAKAREQRQKAEAELAKLKADMETRRQAEAAQREQAAAAARLALQEAEQRNKAETELAALRKADEEARQQAAAAAAAQQQADEAAQRKAEAEAAGLRQAEEDARRKAVAEAEAKQQADEALARAQAERKRADEEAARQRSELEARQKADADAKVKADADAKAKADVAAKQKAEADAKAKAEADSAAEKKAAETTEGALRLTTVDRQRLQVALTSLGFDTRGSDGAFGPRSREMIAAWQQKAGAPATGFLSAVQRDQLLRGAAAAVTRWDDEQKKLEDDKKKAEEDAKKKAEEEAKAKAAQPPPAGAATAHPSTASSPEAAAPSGGQYDGRWNGTAGAWSIVINVRGTTGTATLTCDNNPSITVPITVEAGGVVNIQFRPAPGGANSAPSSSRRLFVRFPEASISPSSNCLGGSGTLARGGAAPTPGPSTSATPSTAAAASAAAAPPTHAWEPGRPGTTVQFDGRWASQSVRCTPSGNYSFSGLTITAGSFTSSWNAAGGVRKSCTVEINSDGSFNNQTCAAPTSGRITGNSLEMQVNIGDYFCNVTAVRRQ